MIQRKVGHKYVALLMVAFVLQLFLNHDLMKKMLGMGGSTSRESDSVNVAATTSTSTSTYMIAIADKSFQQRYDPIFNKMSTYASKYGYEWRVIGDTGTEPECEERFQVYFFRKHCIVAKWMQRETKPGDRVLVFDADVVPYRTHTALEHWLHLSSEDDLVFYDRTWNDEVMAGNYLVKNTKQGQNFLMGWAAWEDEAPSGFSSADNGAIHIHLLQVLGLHTFDKCRKKYKNLTALVTDLDPYWSFVRCTREIMPAGVYKNKKSTLSLRIMAKDTAWAMDGVYDGYEKKGRGKGGSVAPVFHHGVKLQGSIAKDNRVYAKYNLQGSPPEQDMTLSEETCKPIKTAAWCTTEDSNLGTMPTAGNCAKEVKRYSGCGDTFMFSSSYPAWGCRCCIPDDDPAIDESLLWALYSSSNCLVNTSATTSGENNMNEDIPRNYWSNKSDFSEVDMNVLIQNEAAQAKERDAWFHSALDHENKNLAELPLNTFYGGVMIQPNSACPVDLMKTASVNKIFDGGKWLCGASRLRSMTQDQNRTCIVYSLGCQFETSFEQWIQRMTGNGCEVHVYDPTMGPPDKVNHFKDEMAKQRINLHEVAIKGTEGHSSIQIGGNTYKAMGLKSIIEENRHTCIDILKFDIEGAEYDILEDTKWDQLCIGMVLFEVHGGIIESFRGGIDYNVGDAVRHIRRLESAGFHHYKTEQVFVGGNGQAELAFVNFTWLAMNPGLPKLNLKSLKPAAKKTSKK